MTILKSALLKGALVAAIAGGAATMTASTASAEVACNSAGECWHVHNRMDYPQTAGIVIHNSNWRFNSGHYRWRHDRADRGYYRNGVWITF